jgi:predicted NAD/FAD-binding protein
LDAGNLNNRPLNIAVIGTGIAGMSAAWLLHKAHRVTVYEQHDWIGGHANTVDVPTGEGTTPVDTGFIVYNERNYPNLTALFDHLDVPTKESEMSFGASLDRGGFEYSGTNLNGILGQRRNLFRPRFWSMIRDIFSFYRAASKILNDPLSNNIGIGDYLAQPSVCRGLSREITSPWELSAW